jgi:DHA1 family tetracycline resistance protein-like MFS transporter
VGPLLSYRLFYGLAFTMFQTTFAVFAGRQLSLSAQSTSYVLTYVGIVIAAVQGGGISFLTKRLSDKQLVFGGSVLLAVALAAWALTPSVWLLLVVLVPLALAGGVLGVVTNSTLTKSVSPQETGGTLGLSASLDSFARVISPILGGFLIDRLGAPAPGLLSGLIMVWLTAFAWRRILSVPDGACPAPASETLVS